MQAQQRERLITLAARVAAEKDPSKFYALLRELSRLLRRRNLPVRGNGKTPPGLQTH
jgi:hypothetical protein